MKGDKLGTFQSLRNQLKINEMKSIPYALADLPFVTRLLERFQSNPGIKHRKAAKKTLHYLQGTKHYMLTYKR
jgi:hypothetical protein